MTVDLKDPQGHPAIIFDEISVREGQRVIRLSGYQVVRVA